MTPLFMNHEQGNAGHLVRLVEELQSLQCWSESEARCDSRLYDGTFKRMQDFFGRWIGVENTEYG